MRQLPMAALLAALVMATISTPLTAGPAGAAVSDRETRMVARINHTRAEQGLPALRVSPALSTYARHHAADMSGGRALFHTASFSAICCWRAVAENVGYGSYGRVVHRAFLASAPHRANILDPRMLAVGIGMVRRGDQVWVAEVFRQPV